MKAVKASKRLIMSIVAFLVSVILCVGAVLAWFVMNDKVDADSASVNVVNGDIVDFTVTVYYLNDATGGYNKADSGNVKDLFGETYNVDYGSDGMLTSDKDSMRPYGGFGNEFATAVLYEIHYEIRVNSANTYRIYASCPKENTLDVTKDETQKDSFISSLSNVVAYYDAEASGNLYSKTNNRASSFVQFNNKGFELQLQRGIVPSAANNAAGNFEGTSYFIMDYLPNNFIYISSLMISKGGSLNSELQLFGDLTINMEAYDPDSVPDEPEYIDVNETYSANKEIGSKLPVWREGAGYGLYSSVSDGNDYVEATQNGYVQNISSGSNREIYISFEGLEGDISGEFDISASALGSKWDIIQFGLGGAKKFCVNMKDGSGNMGYNMGDSSETSDPPENALTMKTNTAYKVAYKLTKAANGNYRLTLTVAGNAFVTNCDLGVQTIDRITLTSSNSGARKLTIDNVKIVGQTLAN